MTSYARRLEMEYWDLYVIVTERDPEKITAFVNTFIPDFQGCFEGEGFALSTYDGQVPIRHIDELARIGCYYQKSEGGFRLNGNSKQSPDGGWLYFNSDGSLVYGLTAKEVDCKKLLTELKNFLDSKYGYIAGDAPPADSMSEFVLLCSS